MGLLDGRVVVVSGIGPGMGRDVSLACARQGADLVLGARTPEKLEAVGAEVQALGRKAVWRPTNIAAEADCRTLADLALQTFGRIDVLVQNAFAHPPFTPFATTTAKEWALVHKVNVLGTVHMVQAVVPAMQRQGSGSIVIVSSMSARHGEEHVGPYAASKAAQLSMVRTLAGELGPSGIRANAVAPGYIWGESMEVYIDFLARERGVDRQAVYDEIAGRIPLRKIPTSEEIAGTVVFLASDLAAAVTGQTIDANGGEFMAP